MALYPGQRGWATTRKTFTQSLPTFSLVYFIIRFVIFAFLNPIILNLSQNMSTPSRLISLQHCNYISCSYSLSASLITCDDLNVTRELTYLLLTTPHIINVITLVSACWSATSFSFSITPLNYCKHWPQQFKEWVYIWYQHKAQNYSIQLRGDLQTLTWYVQNFKPQEQHRILKCSAEN